MMNHINFHHLLYFREIAREQSIAKAAQKLRLSAPALSMQLKIFEDSLGQSVFDRTGRRLVLNNFGKTILEYAEKVHSLRDELIFLANKSNLRENNNINIGIGDELPKTIVKIIVTQTLKDSKNTTFSLTEGSFESLSKKMISGDLDLILTSQPTNLSRDFICKNFYRKKIGFYGIKSFKHLRKNFPESLEDAPLILPNLHNEIRNLIDQWFIERKIHYQLIAQTQDSSVKKALALDGLGIMPLSELSSKELLESKKILCLGEIENIEESFFYTIKKSNLRSHEVLKSIVEHLKKIKSP